MPNLKQLSEDPVGSESKLTSRNWRRPSSPRYERARWADSKGMMSCTRVIFSERIRSMGGQLSMNLPIIPSILNFPGTKQKPLCYLESDSRSEAVPFSCLCCLCLRMMCEYVFGRVYLENFGFSRPLATAIDSENSITCTASPLALSQLIGTSTNNAFFFFFFNRSTERKI